MGLFCFFGVVHGQLNMLPLLMDVFQNDTIIPIATEKSLKIQKKVIEYLKKDENIFESVLIVDEKRYDQIFKTIATILNDKRYDKIIIDLTHGFRHIVDFTQSFHLFHFYVST